MTIHVMKEISQEGQIFMERVKKMNLNAFEGRASIQWRIRDTIEPVAHSFVILY